MTFDVCVSRDRPFEIETCHSWWIIHLFFWKMIQYRKFSSTKWAINKLKMSHAQNTSVIFVNTKLPKKNWWGNTLWLNIQEPNISVQTVLTHITILEKFGHIFKKSTWKKKGAETNQRIVLRKVVQIPKRKSAKSWDTTNLFVNNVIIVLLRKAPWGTMSEINTKERKEGCFPATNVTLKMKVEAKLIFTQLVSTMVWFIDVSVVILLWLLRVHWKATIIFTTVTKRSSVTGATTNVVTSPY